jgi:hypothetical protein
MTIQMSKDLNCVFNILTSPIITKYSGAVMGYVCLFEVTPFHLKAPKFRRIMEEMKRLFDSESFSFQKKTYLISHAGIVEALDLCIKKNFDQSLENHNYLKRVMITISEREGKNQSRQGEKELRKREGNALAGNTHVKGIYDPDGEKEDAGEDLRPETKPQTLPRPFPRKEAEANLRRVGNIIKSMVR